jgi:geranylgeranyl diphosphate synthase, type I
MTKATPTKKEDFREWMRPHLKKYYILKIDYLRKVIDEAIPANANVDFLSSGLGEFGDDLPLDLVDQSIYQPMREYIKVSGKLFRPLLTCLCIEAFGEDPDHFKPIIAISEIIHSSSLILDDIADASLTRRGYPCSHLVYGIPRAANSSCAMTFFTFRLINSKLSLLSTKQKNLLYEVLLWEHYVTNLGSALDLGWAWEKHNDTNEEEYMQHVLFRSCSYTYRHAARIGSIVGGADSRNLDIIHQFSSLLGLAFQLIDDILNLKPVLKSWGKTVGEDITEGKRSLLVLHCLKKASQPDRNRLLMILNGQVTDDLLLNEANDILTKYDSFNYVFKKAQNYIQKAIEVIREADLSDKYRTLFEEFAWYVTERKV